MSRKDVVLLEGRRLHHETMVEQAGHFAGAGQQSIALELGVLPLGHPLAQRDPQIRMDREDDKDLEGMEAFVRRLVRVAGGDEGGQLDEAEALKLDYCTKYSVFSVIFGLNPRTQIPA